MTAVSPTCSHCSQPVRDITEKSVLEFVGDDVLTLGDLLNGVGGTLPKRSKIIMGLIRRGDLVLTAERFVHARNAV